MKTAQVQVGSVYGVKVGGETVPVVIEREHVRAGGWTGRSLATNRTLRIKSPARLLGPWKGKLPDGGSPRVAGKAQRSPGAKRDALPGKSGKGQTEKSAPAPATEALRKAAKDISKVLGVPVGIVPPKSRAAAPAKVGVAGPASASRMTFLDAAESILKVCKGGPLGCNEMVLQATEAGLLETRGRTPEATLYSAILRDMQKHGEASRFVKKGRGEFGLRSLVA